MNFATWAIRKPIPSIVIFILLTIAGTLSFRILTIQDLPDLDFPAIAVSAGLPGATPLQTETELTRKIEDAIATIPGIKHIYSTINEDGSFTNIQFTLDKNIAEALNDVRNVISQIRANLPKNMTEPIFTKIDTAGVPIVTYAVTSNELREEALSSFIDITVSRSLLSIPGVGKVNRLGGIKQEIVVELDPLRLNALQITLLDIIDQLNRMHLDLTGGKGEVGGKEQNLRIMAMAHTPDQIGAINILLRNGRLIRLDQIATIKDSLSERSQLTLLDGKPVVSFQIQRSRGYSDLEVEAEVGKAVQSLQINYPKIKIEKVSDSVARIREQYNSSMYMLIEGALLAVIVVWFFLRDWRATLISASALPLSVIPTFAFMYVMGFSMNTVTLLALALVIGLLVDDAIVEIENIVRHLGMGKAPLKAASDAVSEIGLAVIATTMTLVAVFLPTAFMGGVAGKFLKQFGWTTVCAVLFSLLVARLLTPMMAAYLLKPPANDKGTQPSRFIQTYLEYVNSCLQHRHLTLIAAILFFVASLALIPLLPTAFIPASDISQTSIKIELEPGNTLNDTHEIVKQVQNRLDTIPEIHHIFAAIGSNPNFGFIENLRIATLMVILKPRNERSRSQTAIENELRNIVGTLPGARFSVGGMNSGEKLELIFSGNDSSLLENSARIVENELRHIPGLGNIKSSASLLQPEIIVVPDLVRAGELGVTTYILGETLRIATTGDFESALPKLNISEKQVNVRVRFPFTFRKDVETLKQLRIAGRNKLVALNTIAEIKIGSGPAEIIHRDRSRIVTIEAELGDLSLGSVLEKLESFPPLPTGIHKQEAGEAEEMIELFKNFGTAIMIGIVCIYLVLVLLFEDFFQPLTILCALPLSIGGAFIALLLTGKNLSMPSLIGIIMLMGIATKNSILLVDYAIMAIKEGRLSQSEALLDACRKRVQPIIMTTFAMGAGMLPIAAGFGADAGFRSPMAIAVIGGLITSTLLSLIVIPIMFTYVSQLQHYCFSFLKKQPSIDKNSHPSDISHTDN